ncbi:MAG TPA: hypothetical protein VFJ90_00510 [Candidatus Didemnitutus sp.]|nr:hypothetical protein [Candidatus Didemnitutus sp.]
MSSLSAIAACTAPRSRRSQRLRAVMAGFMFAVWLLLNAVAASPELHHQLHDDSGHAGHDCLVTQMSSGHLPVEFTATIATVPETIFAESLCVGEVRCDFNSAHLLPHSCGPPLGVRTTAAG